MQKIVPLFEEFIKDNKMQEEKDKTLVILRGLPGAGKSTFAKLLSRDNDDIVCCADDYFTDEQGNYNWNPKELDKAHKQCQDKCKNLMENGEPLIIISNTNVSLKGMQYYFDLAKEYGYRVTSTVIENRHGNKSIHNVPDTAIEKMRKSFDISL